MSFFLKIWQSFLLFVCFSIYFSLQLHHPYKFITMFSLFSETFEWITRKSKVKQDKNFNNFRKLFFFCVTVVYSTFSVDKTICLMCFWNHHCKRAGVFLGIRFLGHFLNPGSVFTLSSLRDDCSQREQIHTHKQRPHHFIHTLGTGSNNKNAWQKKMSVLLFLFPIF